MNKVTQRLKSKTYWAGLIMSLLTIIEAHQQIVSSLVPDVYKPYMPLVFPLVFLILREFTSTALADK